MLCSGHAYLRDRFARQAFLADLAVLAASTWLLTLTFVEPATNRLLTPYGIPTHLWVGVLGAVTFFVTIWQMRADWKGRSDAHRRSFDMYADVHRECGYLLAQTAHVSLAECQRVLARYDMATAVGAAVPEKDFLRLKRRHRLKVAISKHLDSHPGTPIWLVRLVILWRDTRSLLNTPP
jgi:hypothetical protein